MKSFTKRNKDWWNQKYPIVSFKTKREYLVKIKPYGDSDQDYNRGCIVLLYKKRFIKNQLLTEKFLSNFKGKIEIEYINSENVVTEYDYNMINLTKLAVELYEKNNQSKFDSLINIEKNYNDFEEWNGIC